MSFKHIDVAGLRAMLASTEVVLADIRDENAFSAGHIPDSRPLNNDNLSRFIRETDKSSPVVVVCYHGHSSQGAASLLVDQGFAEVYSLDGGYAAWAVATD